MEEKNNDYIYNPFHSRGCCHAPKHSAKCDLQNSHNHTKLDSYDWLHNIEQPENRKIFDCVEVKFKNGRKDFYKIIDSTEYFEGEIVAVEGIPGHDIGIVSLTGDIVKIQMHKKNIDPKNESLKKIYRKAKITDIEKWIIAVENEDRTMEKAKLIAASQKLEMKINDVEYQGDNTKAIFYYTADDRVDFRNLIKVLAEEFRIRIEMKQIGVRQEASRLGGIGTCGRELCCSSWLTNFKSVSTNAARVQQLSLNPQKLAGQCGKLKCCLNFEYDCYADALKDFPSTEEMLITTKGNAVFNKTDVFKKTIWYNYENDYSNFYEITLENVKEIISINKKGEKVSKLEDYSIKKEKKQDFENIIGQDDLTRFDKK